MDSQKNESSAVEQANKPRLRSGFTTGTCATAAAKAAAVFLLLGKKETKVAVTTPKGVTVSLSVTVLESGDQEAVCKVIKDAGDDPDVTNQAAIFASVRSVDFFMERWLQAGYTDPDFPNLCLVGGDGIGIVTKKGLASPLGKFAINPVPRKMILEAVAGVCQEAGCQDKILITVSIPDGIHLASKTFNPNLGIIGGISVLGTSGFVEPMSEKAILDTIRLEIHMKAVEGKRNLIITPGNYGKKFLKEFLGVSPEDVVKCSNFIGDTMDMLWEEGMTQVLLAGHVGKLIKVAGGVMNTHSQYGDRRMEIIELCAKEAGAGKEVCDKILSANTTEEAIEYLDLAGFLCQTMDIVGKRIKENLEHHTKGITVQVVTFSTGYGILGKIK